MSYKATRTLLQPWSPDFIELEPLNSLVKSARVIGVGEGAHFVSEFSLARATFIRYFVETHGFNAIGLECGAIQGDRISKWLNSPSDTNKLDSVTNPLTFALYGAVLVWLKAYIRDTGAKLIVIGIDLPNTLSPCEDLEQLVRGIEVLDPLMKSEVDLMRQSLASVSGESAVVSSMQWGELDLTSRNNALSGIMRLKLRLLGLAPVFTKHRGEPFKKLFESVLSIEHTLETLRIMKTLFDGTSLEGDTSVRESFMASAVERYLKEYPDMKMILLAHNNHIQKTPVSYSGELMAVPMGQHLAHREDYYSIGATHLGATVPEMQYPSPSSPLGFSVEPVLADKIRKSSVEHFILDAGCVMDPCVLLADDVRHTQRIRSQSSSIVTSVADAFDALYCIPSVSKDKLVEV